MRILYVEDEQFLAEAVIHMLKKEHIFVDWAKDGEEGLELAMKPSYDAIVLDVMLPKLSGIDILKTIRDRGVHTPVIMLSALNEVDDKIRGLENGADDYLAKPFKTAELIARLNAITRRPALRDSNLIKFADLEFDPENQTINNLPLTTKEAEIIDLLIQNPDQTVRKEQIVAHVWGANSEADDNYAEVYISHLRKKIASISKAAEIKTVRGVGYKLASITSAKKSKPSEKSTKEDKTAENRPQN